jgi:hypothetical protein
MFATNQQERANCTHDGSIASKSECMRASCNGGCLTCRVVSSGLDAFIGCLENKVSMNCEEGDVSLVKYLIRASVPLSEHCTEDLSSYVPVWVSGTTFSIISSNDPLCLLELQ